MLVILDPILLEGIHFVSHILHLCEVGANIILAQINGWVLHLPLLVLVVDDQLKLHDLKRHHTKDQATRDLTPGAIIFIDELTFLDMEVVMACPIYMVLQNEMKFPVKLLETNLLSIHEAEVTGLVWIDGVGLHASGLGEGGRFVAHKSPV